MALISVDSFVLALQSATLEGAGASLTENIGFQANDIDGMPAARSIVDVIGQLEKTLEAYQRLIEQNSKRIKTIANSFEKQDKSLSA